MKKFALVTLTLAMAISLCACTEQKEEPADVNVSVDAPAETDALTDADGTGTDEGEPEVELDGYDLTQTVDLYDANDITITVDPLYLKDGVWYADFTIVNNQNKDLDIKFSDMILNGYTTLDQSIIGPVKAGETCTEGMKFDPRFQIDKPSELTMKIIIKNDNDDDDTIDDLGEIKFILQDYGYEEPDRSKEVPLYESADRNVYVLPELKINENFGTIRFDLYMENNVDEQMNMFVSNPTLNGNPHKREGCQSVFTTSPMSRGVDYPFMFFNLPADYEVESAEDVTSIGFDLKVKTGYNSANNVIANQHIELEVVDGKITFKSSVGIIE